MRLSHLRREGQSQGRGWPRLGAAAMTTSSQKWEIDFMDERARTLPDILEAKAAANVFFSLSVRVSVSRTPRLQGRCQDWGCLSVGSVCLG